jgi:hypothetical protein
MCWFQKKKIETEEEQDIHLQPITSEQEADVPPKRDVDDEFRLLQAENISLKVFCCTESNPL